MKKIIFLLVMAAGMGAASGFLSSCNNISIRRDGDEESDTVPIVSNTKKYDYKGFDKIEMNSYAKVYLMQDTAFSIVAKGNTEALRSLKITLQDGVLVIDRIGSSGIFGDDNDQEVSIYISLPEISSIDASGVGKIEAMTMFKQPQPLSIDISGACEVNMQIESPKCSLESSGVGQVRLRGATPKLEIDISGAGDIDALACAADSVTVDASGAGEVKVMANAHLSVDASGVGSVSYKGNPVVVKEVSGVADVKQLN
ncbi:hypothetical protein DBR32_06650 [Taibaiella sp. KBW10]|uniref:head GIN domain-containing protein n=1 Tax=Taibaiella sp. KBW10 TaxID=2153357 RepID=UPI000F5A68F2|nr:head GIN domain-containing protein [Taibaiella sp. KBW10]RQO31628.1 hypothetical protein DBR32_06650 [Taibaiella sp. KBW10]